MEPVSSILGANLLIPPLCDESAESGSGLKRFWGISDIHTNVEYGVIAQGIYWVCCQVLALFCVPDHLSERYSACSFSIGVRSSATYKEALGKVETASSSTALLAIERISVAEMSPM